MKSTKAERTGDCGEGFSGLKNNKGFTLIELAIVLVIIGLILGSVLKGKDLINSAKQKNFYNSFVKGWELAVVSYYDRTGHILGDGSNNGGTGTPDGRFDDVDGNTFSNNGGIDSFLKGVGLGVPVSNTAQSGAISFNGAYSGPRVISLNLRYLLSHTDKVSHNRLYFTNMPTDLAIALDKMVDGQINSQTGKFRRYADNTGAGVWPDASTTTVVNASYQIDL